MPRLAVGDRAPDFTLPTADGGSLTLSQLRGQGVVIFFFPAAMTPGCTTEACDFRDSYASLQSAGYTVVGISPDPAERLAQFVDKEQLDLPAGLRRRPHGAGRLRRLRREVAVRQGGQGVIRSTFVIDADGVVQVAKYNVRATGHVARCAASSGSTEPSDAAPTFRCRPAAPRETLGSGAEREWRNWQPRQV